MTTIRPSFAVSWSADTPGRSFVRGDRAATVCSRHIAASVSVLCALASSPSLAAQRPVVPLATRWPTRIAVGMRQGQQLWPLIVEARADGWVIVSVLTRRPGIGTTPPSMQLLVEARDVLRWTRRVRTLTLPPADSADLRRMDDTPILGNGKLRLEAWVRHPNPSPGSVVFSLYPCEGGNESTQPTQAEVASLLALLDSAAMRAGSEEARPPTLARPYYASEASCPADPLAENAAPAYPNGIASSRRRPMEVGAGFVVDTTGRIEHGSLTFMPGTDPRFARAARRAMAHWRFQPAEWDGTPIRQLVQTRIVISPVPIRSDTGLHAISMKGEADGWVHFIHTSGLGPRRAMMQEWYAPDSIDAWARRVDSLNAIAASSTTSQIGDVTTTLAARSGVGYSARYIGHAGAVDVSGGLIPCGAPFVEGEPAVDSAVLARFRAAARDARALRSSPADPARIVRETGDVACPAWLPWRQSPRPEFTRVWQYPTGLYPKSMAASHARADVFASFVVDTAGVVDLETLRVMPGSDPRAVAALPATLRTFRFRPASRGGRAVSQWVIQPVLFEPPPVCATPDAHPACTRRYTTEPRP
jgi:TonB family protein